MVIVVDSADTPVSVGLGKWGNSPLTLGGSSLSVWSKECLTLLGVVSLYVGDAAFRLIDSEMSFAV